MYSNEEEASFIKKNHCLSLSTHGELRRLFREPRYSEAGMEGFEELGGEPWM